MSEKAYVCRGCDAIYWEPVSSCDCDSSVFDEVTVTRDPGVSIRIRAAAEAVLAMECDRVNSDKSSEPYDPIANPSQFDERVVALALALLPETHWRIDSLCCAKDEEKPDE